MRRRPQNKLPATREVPRENSISMYCSIALRGWSVWMGASIFLIAAAPASCHIAPVRPLSGDAAATKSPAIVMGFVGGWIAHDNPAHSEVQLAARLRKRYPAGVYVETFESYRAKRARRKILALLDTNQDGILSKDEKEQARIILYGHSWGGSESIGLAEALEKDGIPVLLTIQVDSVSRLGSNDKIIPANVAQAVNFYQPGGLVHGEPEIRAADAARTKIIGNYRFDYRKSRLNCSEYPWYDRIFVKPHTQIECDPAIWEKVESLIRANLPQAPSGDSSK
jgi:hypothetical protein